MRGDIAIINLELYRIFYFTAVSGSISEAARTLHMTQPSASQAIKQLEEALRITLFHRTPKGVALTVDGKMLFSFIEQAYGLIASAEKKMSEVVPDIKISLTTGSTLRCLQFLKEGAIDFCLVRKPAPDKMLQFTKVLTVQDCFVAGETYKAITRRPISLEQLARLPLIVFPSNMTSRKMLDEFFFAYGLTIQPVFEIGSRDILIDFAKAGLGISCVVKSFIQEELKADVLYEVQLDTPLPMIDFGIVQLKEGSLPTAARTFIEMMVGRAVAFERFEQIESGCP